MENMILPSKRREEDDKNISFVVIFPADYLSIIIRTASQSLCY